MRELWHKVRRWLSRREGLDDDLRDEIQSHFDLVVEGLVERGVPLSEARLRAQREFGGALLTRERALDAWQFGRLETFMQDIRCALRAMRQAPGFALVVVLTLALGIGVNTAIFSVLYAAVLKPLPFPDAPRLV